MENLLDNVLTTGAGGMIGSYVDFGIKTNHRSLDITDPDEIMKVFNVYKPKIILHLAAETDLNRCEKDPEHAYMVNTIGTYYLAEAARQIGAKFIYISTSGIFDGEKSGGYVESDEAHPLNHYGRSKYLGELAVRDVLKDFLILRISWVFGGGPEKDQKFVSKIIEQLGNPEIKAVDDIVGSMTYGKDLIEAIKKLIILDKRGIIHLPNSGIMTRYDAVKEIVKISGSNTKVIPVSANIFKLSYQDSRNQSMISSSNLMRSWQEALKDYLVKEWKLV